MDYSYIIKEFEQNASIFKHMLEGMPEPQYRWKQEEEKWCPLEIICHLHDEEVEDFRTRLRTVIENPGAQPPPIDPVGWVSKRKYIEQDFNLKLTAFLHERQQSISWLKEIGEFPLDNSYEHQKFGTFTAKMFFSNWLAHDYLHIKQLLRLRYDYLKHISDESLAYAGKWL